MPAVVNLSELRESLRKKFPAAHRHISPPEPPPSEPEEKTTLRFDPGTVNEVVSTAPFQGMSLLISQLLAEDRDLPLALIDGRDSFDPASHGNELCRNLFWIRCTETEQIIKATDLLLRDGNLPLILLDLHLVPARELGRIPDALWQRFRTEARSSGSTLTVLSPKVIVTSAHTRHFIEGSFTLDHLEKSTPAIRITPDTHSRMGKTRIS
ncbi:MAG: hypothetical protein ABJQ29_14400 [Luteolibacter sp.]